MATKRARVPTAILKITGFFLKLQGFSEILQVHEIGVNRSLCVCVSGGGGGGGRGEGCCWW